MTQPNRPSNPSILTLVTPILSVSQIEISEEITSAMISIKVLKVNIPDLYEDERGKLNEFLIQYKLYIYFNNN